MSTVAAAETQVPRTQPIVSWRFALGVTVMLLAHVPILIRYVAGVVELPHYEFVLLLPIGAAVLAWPRVKRLGTLSPGRNSIFAVWMFGTLLTLSASIVLDSPWFGAISALLGTTTAAYALGGRRLVVAILPAWALLWLGIRLPLRMDLALAEELQRIAAHRASAVMNYFNVVHILDGNVVETLPVDGVDRRYMVEEACSGVQSLFSITACALFFAMWMRESVGRIILLLAVAGWWVWVANVVRVIAVTVLNSQWGLPVDQGWGHDALSVVLFILTLGLIVSSEHLLLFFLPRGIFSRNDRINIGQLKPLPDYGPTQLPALSRTQLSSPLFIGGYLLIGALQWLPMLRTPPPSATPVLLETVQIGMAPDSINGWRLKPDGFTSEQRRADSQWGARSHTWRYSKGTRELIVSVDYPFRGWHELTICYRADGWNMVGRKVVDVPREGPNGEFVAEGEKCVEAVLHRPELGAYAYLLFTSFNDRQQPLPAQQLGSYQKLKERLGSFVERVRTLGASGGGLNDQVQSFQLQVLVQGPTPPTSEESREAMELFAEFRARLGSYLASQTEGGAQ